VTAKNDAGPDSTSGAGSPEIPNDEGANTRSGYVAIVGRPNVGKSTLLNALVGEKISIVSPKPHTTRHRILGILNRDGHQAVFVDTPGHAARTQRAMHRLMARAIHQAVEDCDLILFVVDARGMTDEDEKLAEMLRPRFDRTLLVLNKVDTVKPRSRLLPMLERLAKEYPFAAFVPISATRRDNLDGLLAELFSRLPPGPPLFPPEMKTDRDLAFRSAEIIREKLMHVLHQEVPYGLGVEIEHIAKTEDERWLVHALIWLERESHKPIVIGKGGEVLKQVGREARLELCDLLGGRVHLEMWVKVREHWSDSERELKRLGFDV
jgi:GTP-binding protein Era